MIRGVRQRVQTVVATMIAASWGRTTHGSSTSTIIVPKRTARHDTPATRAIPIRRTGTAATKTPPSTSRASDENGVLEMSADQGVARSVGSDGAALPSVVAALSDVLHRER